MNRSPVSWNVTTPRLVLTTEVDAAAQDHDAVDVARQLGGRGEPVLERQAAAIHRPAAG